MNALPSRSTTSRDPQVAALSCPDCGGSLQVWAVTHRELAFECRIGHTFGLEELLTAKEERLEDRLWTALTAMAELAALLRDLGHDHAAYADRIAQLQEHGGHIRSIIDEILPIMPDRVHAADESWHRRDGRPPDDGARP